MTKICGHQYTPKQVYDKYSQFISGRYTKRTGNGGDTHASVYQRLLALEQQFRISPNEDLVVFNKNDVQIVNGKESYMAKQIRKEIVPPDSVVSVKKDGIFSTPTSSNISVIPRSTMSRNSSLDDQSQGTTSSSMPT